MSENNFTEAKSLRDKINLISVPGDKPGYYKWFCQKEDLIIILNALGERFDDLEKYFEKRDNLYCIYVGVAINESIRSRLDWHINQSNNYVAVRTGFLSTLRQSIASVISGDMSDTISTNNFIDKLYVEYHYFDYVIKSDEAKEYIGDIERKLLSSDKLYILNIKDNKNFLAKEILPKLKNMRKNAKKTALMRYNSPKIVLEDDVIMIREPEIGDKKEIMALRKEFIESGDDINGGSGLEKFEDYEEWYNRICDYKDPKKLPPHLVPQIEFISVRKSDKRLLGIVCVRPVLNDFLLIHGGHIGDCIRKSERNKGYATRQIALALKYLNDIGTDKVLITCNQNNKASEKTIINNGGVFENEVEMEGNIYKRYWITLKKCR